MRLRRTLLIATSLEFLKNHLHVLNVKSSEEMSLLVRGLVESDLKFPESMDLRFVEELELASGAASVSPLKSLRTKRLAIVRWQAGILCLRMRESMQLIKT